VASVSLAKPEIVTISIPRDLWIPEIRAKINSAYYWGNQKTAGDGITFAKSITQSVVGTPIQYGVVIDFSAFKDIVDSLGGIQVNIENSFTDKLYPIAGRENDTCSGDPTFACRYQTVTFSPGPQTMNGDTALIFVRSRHAEGPEGTDTAREARQQKVIDAIKNKIMNPKVFLSPKIDYALINVLKKYVQTDINAPTAAILARNVLRDKNVKQYLIPDGFLVNPPVSKVYDNQYVFIPRNGNGNWKEINDWVNSVLQ
jgi:LCP family protein required for cell wall assembly